MLKIAQRSLSFVVSKKSVVNHGAFLSLVPSSVNSVGHPLHFRNFNTTKISYSTNGDISSSSHNDVPLIQSGMLNWQKEKEEISAFSSITGQQKTVFDNGDTYYGEWKNGKLDGFGTYLYMNGDIYEGEWLGNMKEGHGSFRYANGTIYEGEFQKDKFSGKGIIKYCNGTSYDGEWFFGNWSCICCYRLCCRWISSW
jgi:hypothetical protein